jgi:ketosteroid isomerase-like protein
VHTNDPARREVFVASLAPGSPAASPARVILESVPTDRLDIARRGIEAYNRGDLDTVIELLDEDIVAIVPDGLGNAGTYRGHDGFRRMAEHWNEAWEGFRIEIGDPNEEGDALIVPVVQHGRGLESGIELSMAAVHLMRFRADRLTYWRLCETREEALEHARAPGAPPPGSAS